MRRKALASALLLSALLALAPLGVGHHGIVYEEEENDDCDQSDAAQNHAFDDHTHSGAVDASDRDDFWTIPNVGADLRVKVSVHYDPAGKDFDLALNDEDCMEVAEDSRESGGTRYVSYDTTSSGPLYIQVHQDEGSGDYLVEVSIKPVPDETDPCDEHPWSLIPHSVCRLLHP